MSRVAFTAANTIGSDGKSVRATSGISLTRRGRGILGLPLARRTLTLAGSLAGIRGKAPLAFGLLTFLLIGFVAVGFLEGQRLTFAVLASTGLALIRFVCGSGIRTKLMRDERAQVADALRRLTDIAHLSDQELSGHGERVAINAVAIGRALGVTSTDLEALFWIGLLHDVGKLGIPSTILAKPGPLTESEQTVMRTHTQLGADIVTSFGLRDSAIVDGIAYHHERWDGRGYPSRLQGTEIPLSARIVAVADVFEAITSLRPYRYPLSVAQAMVYVESESGGHFDPDVVRAFVSTAREEQLLVHKGRAPSKIVEHRCQIIEQRVSTGSKS